MAIVTPLGSASARELASATIAGSKSSSFFAAQ
jgi:hypothetical protein